MGVCGVLAGEFKLSYHDKEGNPAIHLNKFLDMTPMHGCWPRPVVEPLCCSTNTVGNPYQVTGLKGT